MSVTKKMLSLWNRTKHASPATNSAPVTPATPEVKSSASLKPTASYQLVPTNYEVTISVLSDVGCKREINEDCGRYVNPGEDSGAAEKGVLMLVADGVGGNSAGEIASRTAADVISRVYYDGQGDMQSSLVEAFREANREIHKAAAANVELSGMGTTCSALVVKDGRAVSANVGDSRLYLIRDEAIYLMTEDHSVVSAMVKHGLITREQARHHPDKNVIISALGGATDIIIGTWDAPLPVRIGDKFVVCSDGLSDLVEEQEIKNAVISAAPDAACQSLVALAKERGGYDNITVGVLSIDAATTNNAAAAVRITRELECAK